MTKAKEKMKMGTRMAVRSGLKAGRISVNHNGTVLAVRSGLKGGRIAANHNGTVWRCGLKGYRGQPQRRDAAEGPGRAGGIA